MNSDQCVPSLELDGEILERIVEGCEDKSQSRKTSYSSGCNIRDSVSRKNKIYFANPLASSTMIEIIPDEKDSGCSCESVYTWTIQESEEDFILEDSYMKDIDLCIYEDEAPESLPKTIQRTSTRADLTPATAQEVPNVCSHGKDKKDAAKKPMGFLKNLLRIKKFKESNQEGKAGFDKKNILKKMKRFNESVENQKQTLAML